MSIVVTREAIRLAQRCTVEQAEVLLVALQEHPSLPLDLREASDIHLAVVQVLIAAGRQIVAFPQAGFFTTHVAPHLIDVNRAEVGSG